MKKFLALLLVVVMALGVVTACQSGTTKPTTDTTTTDTSGTTSTDTTGTTTTPSDTTTTEPATTEGTFDIAVNHASEPQTIDPVLNSAVDGAIMAQHLFEGLYKWVDANDGTGKAKLELGQAAAVNVSDDGLVYTFTLRDDIKWNDGQDVVAGDFVYAWRRAVDPETAADYNYMLEMVVNANEIMNSEKGIEELGVVAVDDKTLEVTLVAPCPYFDEIVAFPVTFPVRQDIIEQYGDQWTFDPATFITNGPYKMTEWVHNSYILMAQNEYYYNVDALGPDTIKFALMDDTNAIYAAFRSGELNLIEEVPQDEIASLLASGELIITDNIGTYYVCYNCSLAPFDDPRVREAFTLTIDREYIVEQITQTGQLPAGGFVPSGIADVEGSTDDFRTVGGNYYDPSPEAYAANCEKARQLLAEAGYEGGVGFPVVEYLYNTSENHRLIGEALQNMWQTELGVTVTLVNQDWAVFLQTRKEGNYSIARNGWIADYNDPMCFLDMWVTGGGNNDAQYSNPEYDALIAAAKASFDPAERMSLMHQAEEVIMNQDKGLGPIYFYTNKHMEQGMQGMYYTPLGYYFYMYASPIA